MKLTVIGGGGVRTPLFAASALRRAEATGLDELCIMDDDADRLRVIGGLCRHLASQMGSRVKILHTTDPQAALDGARYIVTTIRVGKEQGRVLDERIALRYGVLGQETTGPGGFAMAMRSIPKIMEYAQMAEKVAPGAWIFNFTNPAGLVTQALQNLGYRRVIGICDGANHAQQDVAGWLHIPNEAVRTEVFGLNHLSWTRRAWVAGEDVLPGLLVNPSFIAASSQKVFEEALLRDFGLYLNEYLYYYYYAEQAVAKILSEPETRGEEVLRLNQALYQQLAAPELQADPAKAFAQYAAYQKHRNATYMQYAVQGGGAAAGAAVVDETAFNPLDGGQGGEGYAGVALDLMTALETGKTHYTAVNVLNNGAIEGMQAEDVVEVSCVVENGSIHPLKIPAVPGHVRHLMYSMKEYERLAVDAILQRSYRQAVQALMAHPLVLSYSRATGLTADYLKAHAPYIGEWR